MPLDRERQTLQPHSDWLRSDEVESFIYQNSNDKSLRRRFLSFATTTLSLILTMSLLLNIFLGPSSTSCSAQEPLTVPPLLPLQSCGPSPAEASRRGCLFDPMNLAWQAPPCHDSELIREFSQPNNHSAAGFPGHIFAGPEDGGTPLSEAAAGELPVVFVRRAFMRSRCGFRWTEMNRVRVGRRPLHALLRDGTWATECSELLLDEQAEKNDTLVPVVVAYPECNYDAE